MAYRESGKTNLIGQVRKNNRGEYIRVQKVIPDNGLSSLDIRLMYTNDAGEILPTQKGVRINDEILKDVVYNIILGMGCTELDELINRIIDTDDDVTKIFDGASQDEIDGAVDAHNDLREALKRYREWIDEEEN